MKLQNNRLKLNSKKKVMSLGENFPILRRFSENCLLIHSRFFSFNLINFLKRRILLKKKTIPRTTCDLKKLLDSEIYNFLNTNQEERLNSLKFDLLNHVIQEAINLKRNEEEKYLEANDQPFFCKIAEMEEQIEKEIKSVLLKKKKNDQNGSLNSEIQRIIEKFLKKNKNF